MLTPDMLLATVAVQPTVLFSIGAGTIAAMVSFLALAVVAVLGTVQEAQHPHAGRGAAGIPGSDVVRLAA